MNRDVTLLMATMKFKTTLRKKPDSFLTEMLFLANPSLRRLHPNVLAAMVQLFRDLNFPEHPVYDFVGHKIACAGTVLTLKPVGWATIAEALVAEILSYCVEEIDASRRDHVWADRITRLTHYADNSELTFEVGLTRAEEETKLENVPEATLFRCNGRSWHQVRRYLGKFLLRHTRKNLLADSRYFNPDCVRSEEDVRRKLIVGTDAWVDSHLMIVLRRSKLFDRMEITPKKFLLVMNGHAIDWMHSKRYVSHDKDYDSLFLKYGIAQQAVPSRDDWSAKRIFEAERHEWVLKDLYHPSKKMKRVKGPKYFPKKDMLTGENLVTVWTGRMKYYRVWKYETRNIQTGVLGSVTAGKLSNMEREETHLNEISIPRFQLSLLSGASTPEPEPVQELWIMVEKRTEWTPYGDILEEMFEQKNKPLFSLPGSPQEEVLKIVRKHVKEMNVAPDPNYVNRVW